MATKRKNKGARARKWSPRLLTPEVHQAIVDAVAEGSYATTAARAAGIRQGTYEKWMRDARSDEAADKTSAVRELRDAIDMADASAEHRDVTRVDKPEWRLERMRPEKFGKSITIELRQDAATRLLDIVRDEMSDSAFDELIAAIESAED